MLPVVFWLILTGYWVDKVYIADAIDDCEGYIQSGDMPPEQMPQCVQGWFADVADA